MGDARPGPCSCSGMVDKHRAGMIPSGRNRMVTVTRVPRGEQPTGHPELATRHGCLMRLNVSLSDPREPQGLGGLSFCFLFLLF